MNSDTEKTVSHTSTFGTETKHPSFAQISLHRITGHRTLYGVDFPQGHFMELKIFKSSHHRSLSNDWYHEGNMIITVALSETQWAQLLCSPNTTGVPCTLADTNFPGEGYRTIKPVEHDTGAQGDLHKNEFKETARDAIQAVKDARQKVEAMLAKQSIGKMELRSVFELLEKAEREAIANLPFVIEQAGEAIEKAKTSAMGEVAAYIGIRLQQLGSDALAKQLLPGLTTDRLKASDPKGADSVQGGNVSGAPPLSETRAFHEIQRAASPVSVVSIPESDEQVASRRPVTEPHEGAYEIMRQSFEEEQAQHEVTKGLLKEAKAAALSWKGLAHTSRPVTEQVKGELGTRKI